MRRFIPWVFVTITVWSSVAGAQAPSSDQETRDEEARGLFLAGQAAFTDARYEDALRYFRDAYRLSHRVGLLYNIAVAADRLRHDEEALEAFEQFLREAPEDHPSRRDATVRVEVLRREVHGEAPDSTPEETGSTGSTSASTDTASPASAVTTTAPASSGGGHDATGGWIVLGVGAAVAVVGGVLLGVGQADADSVTGAADGTPWADVQEAAGRADLLRNVGWVLACVGVGAAALGLTWALVESSATSDATARLTIGPGGVLVRGEF